MRKIASLFVGVLFMSSILFEDGWVSWGRFFIGLTIWFGTWIYVDYTKNKRRND